MLNSRTFFFFSPLKLFTNVFKSLVTNFKLAVSLLTLASPVNNEACESLFYILIKLLLICLLVKVLFYHVNFWPVTSLKPPVCVVGW